MNVKGVFNNFCSQYFIRGTLGQHRAIFQQQQVIRKLGCQIQIVDDGHNAKTLGSGQLFYLGHQAVLLLDIQIVGWFIQK